MTHAPAREQIFRNERVQIFGNHQVSRSWPLPTTESLDPRLTHGMFAAVLREIAYRIPVVRRVGSSARKRWFFFRHGVRDIYDSYFARDLTPVRTPLGFLFGGSASQHHRAMQAGTFEPAEVELLTRLLPRSNVFVDVGANAGYFTCLARELGVPAIAIEPMPGNVRILRENLKINGWDDTEVFPVAASSRVGQATLYGASSTGASLINNWAGASRLIKRTIQLSTLDRILDGRYMNGRPLIKADVEGHEYPMLCGAMRTLRRELKPIWILEITFNEYHPSSRNPHFRDTFQLMWQRGYTAHRLEDGGRMREISIEEIHRWSDRGSVEGPWINYVFVPAGVSAG
jgi:FkbM family methyltransferase